MRLAKERQFEEIADRFPAIYLRYRTALHAVAIDFDKELNGKPAVIWLYGDTGTGKSRFAHDFSKDCWVSGDDLKWFDGYQQQECVIFDDFRPGMCTYHYLLRLLDRYPIRVQIKGGFVRFKPKIIFITAYGPPSLLFKNLEANDSLDQLKRRVDLTFNTEFGSLEPYRS